MSSWYCYGVMFLITVYMNFSVDFIFCFPSVVAAHLLLAADNLEQPDPVPLASLPPRAAESNGGSRSGGWSGASGTEWRRSASEEERVDRAVGAVHGEAQPGSSWVDQEANRVPVLQEFNFSSENQ